MISTSVLASADKDCWNQWLDGEYLFMCNDEGRNAIDLKLILGDEAMEALVLEVNKKPAIRIFWGIVGFVGGALAVKVAN